jgi:hypothetical protein
MIQRQKQQPSQNRIELRKFIIQWNNNYPIDFLWRKKYGVAFGSQEHRQMSFLDMMFDLEEEIMMNNLYRKREQNEQQNQKVKDAENSISDYDFDNLDVEQFNKIKDTDNG